MNHECMYFFLKYVQRFVFNSPPHPKKTKLCCFFIHSFWLFVVFCLFGKWTSHFENKSQTKHNFLFKPLQSSFLFKSFFKKLNVILVNNPNIKYNKFSKLNSIKFNMNKLLVSVYNLFNYIIIIDCNQRTE